jgi:hypothetical protein
MEPFAVISVLAMMAVVVFLSGYIIVYAFFRKWDPIEQLVFAGIFGMAQVFVTFFLIKTFFVLGDAVIATLLINVMIGAFAWMGRKKK